MKRHKRFCLFAHFDPKGGVADHVLFYLAALQDCGFKIVFVSNSKLSAGAQKKVSRLTIDVIIRSGGGLDFSSYAVGFASHQKSIGGLLLLANDSVYGPVGDLRGILRKLLSVEADVYGMVESQEITPHLQAWFLIIRPVVYRHPAFSVFLSKDFHLMSKSEVILQGEVGFSVMLRNERFMTHALYRQSLGAVNHIFGGVNPTTTVLWKNLILQYGVPFIKRQLLRDNPEKIPKLVEVCNILELKSPKLAAMIYSHMGATSTRFRKETYRVIHEVPWWSGSHAVLLWLDQSFRSGARRLPSFLFMMYKLLRAAETRFSKLIP